MAVITRWSYKRGGRKAGFHCNGKKDPCAVFGCNNDRPFSEKYTVKDHTSNTKLEKGNNLAE